MIERKVGEVFEVDGVQFIVEERGICGNCYLKETDCDTKRRSENFGKCSILTRSDGKSVSFVKLEKEEEKEKMNGLDKSLALDKIQELEKELKACNERIKFFEETAVHTQNIEMNNDYIKELEGTIKTKDSIIEFLTGFITLKKIEEESKC